MVNYEELKHQDEDRFLDDMEPKEEDRRFFGKPHRMEAVFVTVFLIIFLPVMFNIGTGAGVAYLIAILMALYKGLVFYEEGIIGFILTGVVLSLIFGELLSSIFPDALPYAFISGVIMSLCTLFVLINISSKLRRRIT